MDKGIIYYTDNRVKEPIFSLVQKLLILIGLPVTSVSLKPINFGNNIVLKDRERSYPTMVTQIIMALENSKEDYVFFCENDVLYHPSHFDFTPEKDNVFYYNTNVWRWRLWDDRLINYDRMVPLSCMVANREFALEHYRKRMDAIEAMGLDHFRSREPRKARIWGYEPGMKSKRRGGFSNDVSKYYHSEHPNIDIRHRRTFSSIKCDQSDFRHQPTNWKEITIDEVPGWDLRKLFNGGLRYL